MHANLQKILYEINSYVYYDARDINMYLFKRQAETYPTT